MNTHTAWVLGHSAGYSKFFTQHDGAFPPGMTPGNALAWHNGYKAGLELFDHEYNSAFPDNDLDRIEPEPLGWEPSDTAEARMAYPPVAIF